MAYGKTLSVLLSGLACLGGCISPGRIEPHLLNEYQRRMAGRSPQKRLGQKGIDSLRPALRERIGPELKVLRDPETGKAQIHLKLQDAVRRTLANNIDIRVVSFDVAVAREDMVSAAAAFDYVLYGGFSYTRTDMQTSSLFGGGVTKNRVWNAGLRQTTVTGGSWDIGWTLTRAWDDLTFEQMNPRYDPQVTLELIQPLLRDAWPEFNLSNLRIARINRKISEQEFRRNVEEVVAEAITRYWQLRMARREEDIQQTLLDETIKTLKRVEGRAEIDATAVQIKQAEAAVASRRAVLIRAKKNVLDVQDALVRLLADPQIYLLADYEIVPVTPLNEKKVEIDATDQIMTALQHSPVLEQVRLGIAAARITVRVAKNQLLPQLDLTASTTVQGLASHSHEAHENLGTLDYVGYSIGIQLEYPIGNRQRRSDLRRARLEHLQALTELQNLTDQTALRVKERVREIETTWLELQVQREAVDAAKKELQALEDIEKIRGRLTPEFLQLKLGAQQAVAAAQRAELQAVVAYNTSMIDLARVTGTVLEMHRVKIVMPAILGETGAEVPTDDRAEKPGTRSRPSAP